MKAMLEPFQIMESLIEYVNDAYFYNKLELEGTIQFHLKHKDATLDCFVDVTKKKLILNEGIGINPTVILSATLYNFLNLSSGKLNPVIGVLTRKLRFSGNIGFFKKVMRQKNIFVAGMNLEKYCDPMSDFEKNPHNPWKVPKSVLIINGSPRAQNGYTDFYLQPFIKGLKKVCIDVEMVYLERIKIKSCKGCMNCMMGESGDCIYDGKDDFEQLYEKQLNADLVVFAFPLFMDGMPAILKNYFDRTLRSDYPFKIEATSDIRHSRRIVKNQTMMVFSICGFIGKRNFKAVQEHFKQLSVSRHMPLIGEIYRSGSIYLYNNPLIYQKLNEVIDALQHAGKEIISYGKIRPITKKMIEQNIEKRSIFIKIANNFFYKKMLKNEKTF